MELTEGEANLGEVRFKHYESRRKGKSIHSIQYILLFIAIVLKLYDYLCVVSTMPSVSQTI